MAYQHSEKLNLRERAACVESTTTVSSQSKSVRKHRDRYYDKWRGKNEYLYCPALTQPYASFVSRDHLLWSIFSMIYTNVLCLGFLAVCYSIKSRDQKVMGDITSAQRYSKTARNLNIAALILTMIIVTVFLCLKFAKAQP